MIVRAPLPHEKIATGHACALGIAQPAHSWVSGQLARHWKRSSELADLPISELALAAELHDLGYMGEEARPTWNPQTGLPYSFQDLPRGLHFDVWRKGVEQVRHLSTYAALFVSKHTTHLVETHSSTKAPREEELIRDFLHRSYAEQDSFIQILRQQKPFATSLTPEKISLQQKLVATWDTLSLALCGALEIPMEVDRPGAASVHLARKPADAAVVTVNPWPFEAARIEVRVEARLFAHRCESQASLDSLYSAAPIMLLTLSLEP